MSIKRLTESDKELIKLMYEEKGSHWLAKKIGVSPTAIIYHLKKMGIKRNFYDKYKINGKMFKKHPEYSVYRSMLTRCNNPKSQAYYMYGGAGIKVCEEWTGENGFKNFYNDMGPRPSNIHQIDRINNYKGYSVDNCRWATPKEQAHNKKIPVVKECKICGEDPKGQSRKGRCHACNEYLRRNGIERPKSKKERDLIRKNKIIEKFKKKGGKVAKIDPKTNKVIQIYEYQSQAIKEYGNGVNNCLMGRANTCKGYKWERV